MESAVPAAWAESRAGTINLPDLIPSRLWPIQLDQQLTSVARLIDRWRHYYAILQRIYSMVLAILNNMFDYVRTQNE